MRQLIILVGLGLFAGATIHYFLDGKGLFSLLCMFGLLIVSALHIVTEKN